MGVVTSCARPHEPRCVSEMSLTHRPPSACMTFSDRCQNDVRMSEQMMPDHATRSSTNPGWFTLRTAGGPLAIP